MKSSKSLSQFRLQGTSERNRTSQKIPMNSFKIELGGTKQLQMNIQGSRMKAVVQFTVGKKRIEIPDRRGKARRKQLRMTLVEYIYLYFPLRIRLIRELGFLL